MLGSCWDQGTGEDPTQNPCMTLTLTLPPRLLNLLVCFLAFLVLNKNMPRMLRNYKVGDSPAYPWFLDHTSQPVKEVNYKKRKKCQPAREIKKNIIICFYSTTHAYILCFKPLYMCLWSTRLRTVLSLCPP